MTREGYTTIQVYKTTHALFNQLRAEEAGARGKSTLDQDSFQRFLLLLYQEVRQDPILSKVRKKMSK